MAVSLTLAGWGRTFSFSFSWNVDGLTATTRVSTGFACCPFALLAGLLGAAEGMGTAGVVAVGTGFGASFLFLCDGGEVEIRARCCSALLARTRPLRRCFVSSAAACRVVRRGSASVGGLDGTDGASSWGRLRFWEGIWRCDSE